MEFNLVCREGRPKQKEQKTCGLLRERKTAIVPKGPRGEIRGGRGIIARYILWAGCNLNKRGKKSGQGGGGKKSESGCGGLAGAAEGSYHGAGEDPKGRNKTTGGEGCPTSLTGPVPGGLGGGKDKVGVPLRGCSINKPLTKAKIGLESKKNLQKTVFPRPFHLKKGARE